MIPQAAGASEQLAAATNPEVSLPVLRVLTEPWVMLPFIESLQMQSFLSYGCCAWKPVFTSHTRPALGPRLLDQIQTQSPPYVYQYRFFFSKLFLR